MEEMTRHFEEILEERSKGVIILRNHHQALVRARHEHVRVRSPMGDAQGRRPYGRRVRLSAVKRAEARVGPTRAPLFCGVDGM